MVKEIVVVLLVKEHMRLQPAYRLHLCAIGRASDNLRMNYVRSGTKINYYCYSCDHWTLTKQKIRSILLQGWFDAWIISKSLYFICKLSHGFFSSLTITLIHKDYFLIIYIYPCIVSRLITDDRVISIIISQLFVSYFVCVSTKRQCRTQWQCVQTGK